MTDRELIIICAVRYALGRRTYIVGVVCNFVRDQINVLSPQCLSVIKRDIIDQERNYNLGDDCDRSRWYELLGMINRELDNKEVG